MAGRKCPYRQDAILRGELTYFNGKPCKYGHISERNTIGRYCIACARQRDRDDPKAHYERVNKSRKKRAIRIKAEKEQREALMGKISIKNLPPVIKDFKTIILHKGRQYNCYKSPALARRFGGIFYIGKDCPRRHGAPRYTSNSLCIECSYHLTKKWQKENPDEVYEITKRWRKNHPETAKKLDREAKRKWRAKNA